MTRSDDPSTASALQVRLGRAVAGAIRFAARTSTVTTDPPDLEAALRAAHPAIIALWHGQFMLVPTAAPEGLPVRTVVARHGDAEVLAEALRAFGLTLIRGAGAGNRNRKRDRGGAHLLRSAVTSIADGYSLPMTADVPPGPARQAGLGIVTLARMTGRPIHPFAIASSRYLAFNTWSRLTLNLPFSRIGMCLGSAIHVPRAATSEELEGYRLQVQEGLDVATRAAYRLAGAEPLRATPPAARLRMGGPAKPDAGAVLQIYRAATQALRPVVPFLLRRRAARGKEDPERQNERFGIASRPRPDAPLVWLHAASVGETNTVLPIIAGLARMRPDLSFLLTTGTVTSARLAASRLPPDCVHQFVPLDAAAYLQRFLDHWRPDLAILTESEIWPNLVLETAARGVPIALVNGRMSRRSYRGWSKRRTMALPLFSRLDLVLAQNARLADWFTDLGAPRVVNAGNLKMDAPAPPVDAAAFDLLSGATQGRTVFLAASTHDDEEVQVAGVHQALKSQFPTLLTIIAPRHPERGPALAVQLAQRGLAVRRRAAGDMPDAATDIYLADTIGELGTLYALAPLCLVGGSLVPHGGQNPIEAVKHGCGVLMGPHTTNFADTYEALLEKNGALRVTSADQVQARVRELLLAPEKLQLMRRRAEVVVEEMTGALARSLAALEPMLPAKGWGARTDAGPSQAAPSPAVAAKTSAVPSTEPVAEPVSRAGLWHAD